MAADSSIQSKLLIPEEWANRAYCPVCGSVYLSLKRSNSHPDQLACDACKARFEISEDGDMVRVVLAPPGLPTDLVGKWVNPVMVTSRGKTAAAEASVHLEADANLIDVAVAAPAEVKRRLLRLYWAGMGLISLLVMTIAAVVGLGLAERRAAVESNLPPAVRALLTASEAGLNIPVVTVYKVEATGSVSSCPTEPASAATMFGGESGTWTSSRSDWTMVTTKPVTIQLPEGMRAEYLLIGKPPRMVAVSGPVRLENVVYLSISCQQ